MKQRQYTELQIEIMNVLERLSFYLNEKGKREMALIRKDYDIKEPYLTLREYIDSHSCGSYHTFHFVLNGKKISLNNLGYMLDDELCVLYPLTKEFYVVEDNRKDNNGNCENYHCDHYLILKPKED